MDSRSEAENAPDDMLTMMEDSNEPADGRDRRAGMPPNTHIIACATVAEELRHMDVPEEGLTVLEFGLHTEPEKLKTALQAEVDSVEGDCDILLGYGLCSYAVVGLKSERHRLVIPKVDDCIPLFIGSREKHLEMLHAEPGTYYLTKGWVEAQDSAYREYLRLAERYGEARALRVMKVMLANYTRVALINTGNYRMDDYRAFARMMADFLELNFEEIPGSNRMLLMMLDGGWDDEFVVVEPDEEITLEHFQGSNA
jgi:hypothetical protein